MNTEKILSVISKLANELDELGFIQEANSLDSVLQKLAEGFSSTKYYRLDIFDDPYQSHLTYKDTEVFGDKEKAEKRKKELEEQGLSVALKEEGGGERESQDPLTDEDAYIGFEELEDKDKHEMAMEGDSYGEIDPKLFYEDEEKLKGLFN